jgi:hypothetical protein
MKSVRLVTAVVVATMLFVTSARANDRAEAEKQFRAGVSLQKVEDFEAALAAFEASLGLFPTKSALFNLANCLRATHRYPEALARFEQLESEYGPELTSAMRGQVDVQIAELENLTATVTVEVDRDGAEVRVDGKLLGTSPLAQPVRLSLGDHRLEVSLDGFETASLGFNLKPRENVTRRIALQELAPRPSEPAPAPVVSPPPAVVPAPIAPPAPALAAESPSSAGERGGTRLNTFGWATAGVGAALLAGGGATGIWALSLDADLEDACRDGHCPASRASDIDRLEALARTTNVLLGLGAAAAAAGVVMLLLDAPETEPGVETTWNVAPAPGGFAAGVRHRF